MASIDENRMNLGLENASMQLMGSSMDNVRTTERQIEQKTVEFWGKWCTADMCIMHACGGRAVAE